MLIEMQPMTGSLANEVSSHVWKHVLVAVTTGLLCLCGGFSHGYSAELVLNMKNGNNYRSDHDGSWIAATAPLSMAFGCVFSGLMIDSFGRKYTHILFLWPFMVGYLILAFAKSATYFLLGRFLIGMCTAIFRSIGAVYLVEVSDIENRALFQLALSLAESLGILCCHLFAGYHLSRLWCLISTTPIFIAFIFLIFLKESPLWLISKGKIEEGIESFEWYRCKNNCTQKELSSVLEKQNNKANDSTCTQIFKVIFSKMFLKAYCTGLFLLTLIQCGGINGLIFYLQEVLKPALSGKIDPYLLLIVVDSLRIVANIVLIPILKYCPRRKSLFISLCTVILLLVAIIVFLIIEPTNLSWLLLICSVAFILTSCIMITLAWTFVAEIFPNEIRGIGTGISGSTSYLLLYLSVLLIPRGMATCDVIVLYSIGAIISTVSMIILLVLLPENDRKTLYEIEKSYNT